MTPKEKAEELFMNFLGYSIDDSISYEENAKQCALIAVDEIIESNPTEINELHYIKPYTTEYMESSVPYWQEVKQEIEKL